MKKRIWWPVIIMASGIAVVLAMITPIPSPVRTVIAFWFLLVCPGMAFVGLLDIQEPWIRLTLAIALSIAMTAVVAEAMLFFNTWSPLLGVFILVYLSQGGVILQFVQAWYAQLSDPDRCRQDRRSQ